MGRARDRKLEDAVFFIQYAATNMPAVFAFADVLYEPKTTPEETVGRYSKTIAKGAATSQMTDLLLKLEEVQHSQRYEDKEALLHQAHDLGAALVQKPQFFGNRDWLKGQLLAQKHYLGMARADDQQEFESSFRALQETLGTIEMYRPYVNESLSPELAGKHVATYWRGPLNDRNVVGLPENK